MSLKFLINGPAGAGKTDLLRSLGDETFVISRDAKKFTFPIPHMLVQKYYDMTTFLYGGKVKENGEEIIIEGVYDKLAKYVEHFGKPPKNVAIDTTSQIWMDVIEVASLKPNVYGSQGAEVTKEMGIFVKFVHEVLELNGINVIFLNHVIEEKQEGKPTGAYEPFGQGKFKDKGGFYSTVNEAITIVPDIGGNRVVYTRDHKKQARTHQTELPDKMWVENTAHPSKSKKLKEGEKYFNLKEHIELIEAKQNEVTSFEL